MTDCKFAAHCGGGHTTAQHWLRYFENIIKENRFGIEAFYAIEEAVNREASLSRMADRLAQGGANHTTTNDSVGGTALGGVTTGQFFDRY
jgi:hypothetical protein